MIESYAFGKMIIRGEQYVSDLIISPDMHTNSWHRQEKHQVTIWDLAKIIKLQPHYLLIGTGDAGELRVLPETQEYLKTCGIQLIFETTEYVYKLFNAVYRKGRVSGAFHLGS